MKTNYDHLQEDIKSTKQYITKQEHIFKQVITNYLHTVETIDGRCLVNNRTITLAVVDFRRRKIPKKKTLTTVKNR